MSHCQAHYQLFLFTFICWSEHWHWWRMYHILCSIAMLDLLLTTNYKLCILLLHFLWLALCHILSCSFIRLHKDVTNSCQSMAIVCNSFTGLAKAVTRNVVIYWFCTILACVLGWTTNKFGNSKSLHCCWHKCCSFKFYNVEFLHFTLHPMSSSANKMFYMCNASPENKAQW